MKPLLKEISTAFVVWLLFLIGICAYSTFYRQAQDEEKIFARSDLIYSALKVECFPEPPSDCSSYAAAKLKLDTCDSRLKSLSEIEGAQTGESFYRFLFELMVYSMIHLQGDQSLAGEEILEKHLVTVYSGLLGQQESGQAESADCENLSSERQGGCWFRRVAEKAAEMNLFQQLDPLSSLIDGSPAGVNELQPGPATDNGSASSPWLVSSDVVAASCPNEDANWRQRNQKLKNLLQLLISDRDKLEIPGGPTRLQQISSISTEQLKLKVSAVETVTYLWNQEDASEIPLTGISIELFGLFHEAYRALLKKKAKGDFWATLRSALSNLAQRGFWARVGSSLLFVLLVASGLLPLCYGYLMGGIGNSPATITLYLFSLPTFALATVFKNLFPFDPVSEPGWAFFGGTICALLASGITYDLLQTSLGSVREIKRESYMVSLRTLGVIANPQDFTILMKIKLLLQYLVRTSIEIFLTREFHSRWLGAGDRKVIYPFVFRAAEYRNLEKFRLRLPYLLDAMVIIGIMFELKFLLGDTYLQALSMDAPSLLVEATTGMILIGLVFRLLGRQAERALFH